jgi:hypothetical protein
MNKLYLISFAFLVLTAAFAAHSFARTQASQDSPSQEDRLIAVALVRTINTAEAGYRFSRENGGTQPRNHFVAWSDLYSSGVLDKMKPPIDVASLISPDGIQGHKLALIVSPDGQSYQLALHDAKPENGLFSVFSDQTGIIYTGSPLQ